MCGAAHHGRLSITRVARHARHGPAPSGPRRQPDAAGAGEQARRMPQAPRRVGRDPDQLPKRLRRDDILGPRAEFDAPAVQRRRLRGARRADRKAPRVGRPHDLVRKVSSSTTATGNRQGKIDLKPWLAAVDVLVKHGVPWTIHAAVACDRVERGRTTGERTRRARRPARASAAAKFNNVPAMTFPARRGRRHRRQGVVGHVRCTKPRATAPSRRPNA